MALCQTCGAQQEEGAGFCPHCGSLLAATMAPVTSAASFPPHIAPIAPQASQLQYQPAPQVPNQPMPQYYQPAPQMQSLSQYQQTMQSPYQPAPQQPYPQLPQRQYQGIGHDCAVSAAQPGQEIKKGMAVLCYLSGCVIIPLLASRKNPFVRYHVNQGLLLFILFIVASIVSSLASYVLLDVSLAAAVIVMAVAVILYVMVFIFSLFGIINAAKGWMRPSPLFGRITILR